MRQKHFFDEIKHKSRELGFDDFGVTDLKNFGAGDLLEIYDEKEKNFFIPMDKNNIVSVDIVNKIIITDPLLGLID